MSLHDCDVDIPLRLRHRLPYPPCVNVQNLQGNDALVVGALVGDRVVGVPIGDRVVGVPVGDRVVGTPVGDLVVGAPVGDLVVGAPVGAPVGDLVVGAIVGDCVGVSVNAGVGACVHMGILGQLSPGELHSNAVPLHVAEKPVGSTHIILV